VLVVGLVDLDGSLPVAGGPRASSPARSGLNRPASLLPKLCFAWVWEGVLDGLKEGIVAESRADEGGFVEVDLNWVAAWSAFPRVRLLARASGMSDT